MTIGTHSWVRFGIAITGGALALVAARRLGLVEPMARWCESEDEALQELRCRRGTVRGNSLRSSRELVSESRAESHRGYREADVDDVIKALIAKDAVGLDSQPVMLCYDMDALKETLLSMRGAFPKHFLHAIAVKSNPLPFLLRSAVDMGFGLECASIAEVVHSLRQGCPPAKIMFDSPAKSKREITFALRHGVQLNADNFSELDRIAHAHAQLQREGVHSTSHIGVRVNPLVGMGSIKALSVSNVRSKFGIPLDDANRRMILDRFRQHAWLDSVHIHVGSQGCSMEQHSTGAARLAELVAEIEAAVGAGRIRVIDIGGGLPVNFETEEVRPQYGDYAEILRRTAPAIFEDPSRTVVTEFGRSVSAKAAFAVCAVEYVKHSGDGLEIAVIQAGADLFMRTCYCPSNFPLRISAHNKADGRRLFQAYDDLEHTSSRPDANGNKANGLTSNGSNGSNGLRAPQAGYVRAARQVTIAGPLCFGGDTVANEVSLPELTEGDFVVVHDAGANTIATFSRHCSRTLPPVCGYYRNGGTQSGGLNLVLLKCAESVEHALSSWGDV